MPVHLGISPIGWSNDELPELGGDTPRETRLAEARLAGFEGIELGNKFPREPATSAARDPPKVRPPADPGLAQRARSGAAGRRGNGGDRGPSRTLPPIEGVTQSVALLRRVIAAE